MGKTVNYYNSANDNIYHRIKNNKLQLKPGPWGNMLGLEKLSQTTKIGNKFTHFSPEAPY